MLNRLVLVSPSVGRGPQSVQPSHMVLVDVVVSTISCMEVVESMPSLLTLLIHVDS